jgi:hypothetical protein
LDDGHQAACTARGHLIDTDRRDETRREESPRALSGFAARGALQRSAASRPGGCAKVSIRPLPRRAGDAGSAVTLSNAMIESSKLAAEAFRSAAVPSTRSAIGQPV